jgi:hypothetical protein
MGLRLFRVLCRRNRSFRRGFAGHDSPELRHQERLYDIQLGIRNRQAGKIVRDNEAVVRLAGSALSGSDVIYGVHDTVIAPTPSPVLRTNWSGWFSVRRHRAAPAVRLF